MKKVYTIRINPTSKRLAIWYSDKKGREYEAELTVRPGLRVVIFQVTQSQFVYPEDCEVVGERMEEIYQK